MRILQDPFLASYHLKVLGSLMFTFKVCVAKWSDFFFLFCCIFLLIFCVFEILFFLTAVNLPDVDIIIFITLFVLQD